jgi:hypothetical protein
MVKYKLAQFVNPILRIFGYGFQRMAQYDTETFEIIYHPWGLKKLKQK